MFAPPCLALTQSSAAASVRREAVLEVAVHFGAASARLDGEPLLREEDEVRERAEVPLVGGGWQQPLGRGAREEVNLEELAASP